MNLSKSATCCSAFGELGSMAKSRETGTGCDIGAWHLTSTEALQSATLDPCSKAFHGCLRRLWLVVLTRLYPLFIRTFTISFLSFLPLCQTVFQRPCMFSAQAISAYSDAHRVTPALTTGARTGDWSKWALTEGYCRWVQVYSLDPATVRRFFALYFQAPLCCARRSDWLDLCQPWCPNSEINPLLSPFASTLQPQDPNAWKKVRFYTPSY